MNPQQDNNENNRKMVEDFSSLEMRKNFGKILLSDSTPGNGEMKRRIREYDWSKTDLGPIEEWPICLSSTISTMLSSHFPYLMFWGPNHIVLYNDAYVPIVGAKNSYALGLKAEQLWEEVWEAIKPITEDCYKNAAAIYVEDALFFLERNGYKEEGYFTYSFGPVIDENLKVGGICIPQVEATKRVIAERRLNILKESAAQTNKPMSLNEACTTCTNVFGKLSVDIPFSLVYLLDDAKKHLDLKAFSGYQVDNFPEQISRHVNVKNTFSDSSFENILLQALHQTDKILKIENPAQKMGAVPLNNWNEIPTLAVAIQINNTQDIQEGSGGLLIVGINTRRAFDTDYQTFVELLASQLSNAISTALSYEHEKKKAEELSKLDEAKTAFFTNISHEFRTPLSLILSGLEQLEKDDHFTAKQMDAIGMISRNSKRLLKLVTNLLDFSRIEAGRIEMCFAPCDVIELTKAYATLFESMIKNEGLGFEFYAEPLPELVYLDTNMWEKIIMNLVSNAFKFTLEGKIQIFVKPSANGNNLEVIVKDTGVGIEEAEIPNLFKRFYRIAGSKGRSFEGSGIGLAFVQELVKYHGGTIQVSSVIGKGTTFTIIIPFGKSHLPRDKISEEPINLHTNIDATYLQEANSWKNSKEDSETNHQSTPADKFHDKKIVFVDDNSDMRRYIRTILSPLFQVHTCCDGQEAYNYILKNSIDLVLSDVMMPNMDGFELLKALRSHVDTHHIPVILLSARAGEEAKVEGLQRGANDYLVKTAFSEKELISRIISQLELHQLRMNLNNQVKATESMLDRLKQTQQTQEEFIDTVCHEIRNPLAGILGSSEVIQEVINTVSKLLKNEQYKELQDYLRSEMSTVVSCISSIQECVTHQTLIANDVLSLSKIDAGKIELNFAEEPISPLIKSSIGLFTSQVNEKKLTIISNVPEDLVVDIDARKYKQIVINFLSNAIKFSLTGKQIWITVEYINNKLKTSVKDEGKGMTDEEQKQLFQRFSQINHSKGTKYEGFGLGLAICSKLVKILEGEIQVESGKEAGATFSFLIPCRLCKSHAPIAQKSSSASNLIQSLKLDKPVLVVEDNEINQKVLKRMLTSKGVLCEVAVNGREAVEKFTPNKYCLIFMDVLMPEMNGLEATKRIRQIDSEIPIVGLSGNARQEHHTLAYEAGMNDYIIKPVLSDTVFKILNKYCN